MDNRKLLKKAIESPNNFRFDDFVKLVEAFGFSHHRTTGGHRIFAHPQVRELVNLQNVHGKAKPYQIRQFLKLIERYNLPLKDQS
jgi:predicted RNA binding protein YcfA (HicA-like mRNA interferase family)